MNVLMFQHLNLEGGGSVYALLKEAGVTVTAVNFERGDAIPDLAAFDAMLVLGGTMDVWDVEKCPWLINEKRAIRRWVRDLNKPYLGLCLGHQLLADALGGTCGPQTPMQVGPFTISLTPEGEKDPIFAGFSPQFPAYKWHGVRVAQMPEGSTKLAYSPGCTVDAMRVADRAWGVQFHPELKQGTLLDWYAMPGSPELFRLHFGERGIEAAIEQADPLLNEFHSNSARIVGSFMDAMT